MPASPEIIYFSGLFDGEGCILSRKGKHPSGTDCWQVWISVANNNKEVMDWLVDKIGGNYYVSSNKHISYTWTLWKRDEIKKLLENCLDFLIVKKKQARVCLKILEKFHKGIRGKDVSSEEIKERSILVNKLRGLKHNAE